MRLYDVPKNTFVIVMSNSSPPPYGKSVPENTIVKFGHIDGMYSYCQTKDGEVVHLPAWQEVDIVGGWA